MKQCLFCSKEFEPQRTTAKYCSDNCRVKWNKKNKTEKSQKDTSLQMQVILNTVTKIFDKINNIEFSPFNKESGEISKSNRFILDEVGTWQSPKTFQQFMNQIADLQYEAEYKALYDEIEASDLTKKQKDLLFINMRSSKSY